MRKGWYVQTVEYDSAVKKSEIVPFAATWIDLQGPVLSEVSQAEKDKHRMISLGVESDNQSK